MKLSELNDGEEIEDQLINAVDKYGVEKKKGNISRKQANDNPNRSEPDDSIPHQTDRSGNQQTASNNNSRIRKFVGATGGTKDKIKPTGVE